MQPYCHDPSLSSAVSRDPEIGTVASHKPSTAPTSTLPPQPPVTSTTSSGTNRKLLANSNTLPVLTSRDGRRSRALPSSATWTSSSADLALFSDTDEVQDRRKFVQEYNRLAKKHGMRVLVVEDFEGDRPKMPAIMSEKRSWWSRVLRSTSSGHPASTQASRTMKHKRSVSDIALHLVHSRRPEHKTIDMQTMVRLSGKSFLYLPPEYSPCSLILPTCFRATAQYLVQYGPVTRGVFRIPGSLRVVNTLFDYYCDKAGEEITGTIRCPALPLHINLGAHDVASAFKKFLSVLPGGILGSLSLFDALVAVHSQLRGEPELSRTRDTKLRARLIALAVGTVKSQFRRELICAVFGLLSIIGRAAETAAREDDQGRPLPTSDLMGYTALGVVFGPLLIGELLNSYTMKLANPSSGLLLFPLTPPQLKKERHRTKPSQEDMGLLAVDKIHVANDIAEMLITNWREVVRNLRSLAVLRPDEGLESTGRRRFLRSSSSEPFTVGLPKGWRSKKSSPITSRDREGSPTPDTPTPAPKSGGLSASKTSGNLIEKLDVKRSRPRVSDSASSTRLSLRQSYNPLSPTAEESLGDGQNIKKRPDTRSIGQYPPHITTADQSIYTDPEATSQSSQRAAKIGHRPFGSSGPHETPRKSPGSSSADDNSLAVGNTRQSRSQASEHYLENHSLSDKSVPERVSSKSTPMKLSKIPKSADRSTGINVGKSRATFRSDNSSASSSDGTRIRNMTLVSSALRRMVGNGRNRTSSTGSPTSRGPTTRHLSPGDVSPRTVLRPMNDYVESPTTRSLCKNDLAPEGKKPRESFEEASIVEHHGRLEKDPKRIVLERAFRNTTESIRSGKSDITQTRSSPTKTPRGSDEEGNRSMSHSSIQITPIEYRAEMKLPASLKKNDSESPKARLESVPLINSHVRERSQPDSHAYTDSRFQGSVSRGVSVTPTVMSTGMPGNRLPYTAKSSPQSVASKADEVAERSRASSSRPPLTPPRTSGGILGTLTPSAVSSSKPGGVRAMAAMFEGAAKDLSYASSPMASNKSRISQNAASLSPSKLDTPTPKTLRPTASIWSLGKGSFDHDSEKYARPIPASSGHQKTARNRSSSHAARRPIGADVIAPKIQGQSFHQLRPTPDIPKSPKVHQKAPTLNEDRSPPSLGTMVRPAEQPPIAQHVSFPRPPSSRSMVQHSEDTVVQRPASPGGNSLLHTQIRNLQKQLDAKTEEAASLRRQLETREDMDVGTLSERLRAEKRECTMWKGRAEAAEKRVAALERFTRRLRGIKAGDAQHDVDSLSQRARGSIETTGTEDDDLVASRIRKAFKGMDGTRSSDGGAAAWWNEGRVPVDKKHTTIIKQDQQTEMTEPALSEVWVAALELLADEGF